MKQVVVILHGALRTRFSMKLMEHSLKKAGFEVINRSYPWRDKSLRKITQKLHQILQPFRQSELYFVTHSYGGLVARYYLGRYRSLQVKRMVMLAPPNQGSCVAQFHENAQLLAPAFRFLYGKSSKKLSPLSVAKLPQPKCEFAVIAGGTGKKRGYAPFLPGDNDGVVCVAETQLPNMRAFLLVHNRHTFIMNSRIVIKQTIHFLQNGKFFNS